MLPPRSRSVEQCCTRAHEINFRTDGPPGVGRYTVRRSLSSLGVRFSQSERPRDLFPHRPETTPGSCYSQSFHSDFSARTFAKTTRPNTVSSISRVGPGEYWSENYFCKRFTFGAGYGTYRAVFLERADRERLGRGCSQIGNLRLFGKDSVGVRFTRSQRSSRRRTESDPGPGAYESGSSLRQNSVSLGRPRAQCSARLDFRKLARMEKSFWAL